MSIAAPEAHPPLIMAAVYLQLIQVCKGTSTAKREIGYQYINKGIRDAGSTADFRILFEIFEILEILDFF